MRSKLANKGQANSVNAVAKKVAQGFEAAEDQLVNKKHAPNKNSLTYASDIKNRLG